MPYAWYTISVSAECTYKTGVAHGCSFDLIFGCFHIIKLYVVEGVFVFIRHKQDTENCIWADCRLTSGIYCLFKNFFGHVCCCADFVNLLVFIFAVIYDVLIREIPQHL